MSLSWHELLSLLLHTKLQWILLPCIAIRKKFAALWIICVITNEELPQSIHFAESNTYIVGEYFDILPKCYSIFTLIFASRWNTSTSKHHFFASSIRLGLKRFAICFEDESWSGTPLRRNLLHTALKLVLESKYDKFVDVARFDFFL